MEIQRDIYLNTKPAFFVTMAERGRGGEGIDSHLAVGAGISGCFNKIRYALTLARSESRQLTQTKQAGSARRGAKRNALLGATKYRASQSLAC